MFSASSYLRILLLLSILLPIGLIMGCSDEASQTVHVTHSPSDENPIDDDSSDLPDSKAQQKDAEPEYAVVHGPLLGFVIEVSDQERQHRLVELKPIHRTITSGDLKTCERRLLKELKTQHGTGNFNIPIATMGGKQVWADRLLFASWRIQENTYTGHCRLLDPKDVRRAWGTHEACRVVLEGQRQKLSLKWVSDHLVILLHGLGRSKDSFKKMKEALQENGYAVADVNYPSTRKNIREHAMQMTEILESSDGITTVSFVTHSLGGIIVRSLLSNEGAWKRKIHVHRLVMIAPPNRGSIAAETLKDWFP